MNPTCNICSEEITDNTAVFIPKVGGSHYVHHGHLTGEYVRPNRKPARGFTLYASGYSDVETREYAEAVNKTGANATITATFGTWYGNIEPGVKVELFECTRATAEAVANALKPLGCSEILIIELEARLGHHETQ